MLASDWDHYIPIVLLDRTGLGDISVEDIETANKILEYYIGSVSNFNAENFQAITNMKTDSEYWFDIEQTVSLLSSHGVLVYQYIFSYRGERSFYDGFVTEPGQFGVGHADELFYLFDPLYSIDLEDMTPDDRSVQELLVSCWTNFSKYGDPSPPGSNFYWIPVGADSRNYLNITGTEPVMQKSQEYVDRMEFWKSLFP